MAGPRLRFTIRGWMAVMPVVACFFACVSFWGALPILLVLLAVPCVAVLTGQWFLFRRQQKRAAVCWGCVATLVNGLYVAICTFPDSYLLSFAAIAWLFLVVPSILGLGGPWAVLATRDQAIPRRTPGLAWLLVCSLTLAPLVTLWTLGPLRLFFFAARPAMDGLADQTVAGRPVGGPQWIGVFRFRGSFDDAVTGDMGLLVEPNPNHPSGFVREGARRSWNASRRVCGSNLRIHLGGDWWYLEDD